MLAVLLLQPAAVLARDTSAKTSARKSASVRLNIVGPALAEPGAKVRFVARWQGKRRLAGVSSVRWRFGDGTAAISSEALGATTHVFAQPGTYRVVLRVNALANHWAHTSIVVRAAEIQATPTPAPNDIVTTPTPETAAPPLPTLTATPTPTPPTGRPPVNPATPTRTPSRSPTRTATPTVTRSATPTRSPTATLSATPTPLPTLPGYVTTVPKEITSILPNPGMGWQSGDVVDSSGIDVAGYPIKVAYVKFYWKNLETADGVFDFSSFDRFLSSARSAGQKLAFRIIVSDNLYSGPQWLRSLGVKGYWYYDYTDNGSSSPQMWTPDFNDTTVQAKHTAFLRELGRRYDGDPAIDSIDIGSIGVWGEWHFWGVTPAVPMPSQASLRAVIDAYFSAFPTKPKVMQLNDATSLAYAVSKGAGFRGDCIGFVDNQMRWIYDPNIAAAAASNAWKNAPNNFEACWNIQYWVNQGWDIKYVVDWALANHITAFNNKNFGVPTAARAQIDRLVKGMGYRFVVTQARFPVSVNRNSTFTLSTEWANRGVAPAYADYVLGVRLRPLTGTGSTYTLATGNKTKQWLPGTFLIDQSISLPSTVTAGNYEVAVAVIRAATMSSDVQLAIAGRDASGWYPMGTITVK